MTPDEIAEKIESILDYEAAIRDAEMRRATLLEDVHEALKGVCTGSYDFFDFVVEVNGDRSLPGYRYTFRPKKSLSDALFEADETEAVA